MAQTGHERPQPGDAPKISGQRARQDQNVKGMIWVLVIGIALVVAVYAVMLALQAQPGTPGNEYAPAAQSEVAPVAPETAKSPQ
jgi:hypothetical protein